LHLGFRFNGVRVASTFDFGLRPEHFTFIAVQDFNSHDFAHHRLPAAEVTRIYTHTTVINNYEVHNNTVINNGIKIDRVAAATHTEIRKVPIRDVPAGTPASATRGGARTEAVVYRPQLKAPAHSSNIVAQKVDSRHPVIQHAPAVAPITSRPTLASTAGNSYQGNYNRSPQGSAPYLGRAQQQGPANSTTSRPARTTPSSQTQAGQKASRAGVATGGVENKPAANTARPSSGQNPANRPSYPLRAGQSGSVEVNHQNGQNTSTYNPKGYQSRSDTRPADSRGQNANNSRPDNNNRGGRKNEP